MKRSNTPSLPTSRRADRSPAACLRTALAFAAALLIALGTGCVTAGKHDAVVAERDELGRQKQALEQQLENERIGNQSLEQELETLLEDFEDVRISREELVARVSALSAKGRRMPLPRLPRSRFSGCIAAPPKRSMA